MADMLPKVSFLRERFEFLNIQVDGGVGPSNIGWMDFYFNSSFNCFIKIFIITIFLIFKMLVPITEQM